MGDAVDSRGVGRVLINYHLFCVQDMTIIIMSGHTLCLCFVFLFVCLFLLLVRFVLVVVVSYTFVCSFLRPLARILACVHS